MKKPSDTEGQREQLRNSIIGLGERSIRKNYYPELQKRIAELERINEELLLEITDRQKAQASKKILERQLQQSQKMEAIGTLAGGIAHDFNNILSAILGFAELSTLTLQHAEFPEKQRVTNDLEQILKAGQRAKELIKQILAYSRQQESQRTPCEVNTVIREALKLLRSSIPKSIEIRQNIADHDTLILADPTQIHQIIMNLCTNANHAMRDIGGTLTVELVPAEIGATDADAQHMPPGPYLLLKVTDTGKGMDQAVLERIFDPYFTTKKSGEGTGMGLAVVHGIVENHQGSIFAFSEPGKGSSFHLYFPRIDSNNPEVDVRSPADIPTGTERILIVDDEPILARVEQRLLESLGYRVTSVTNPCEALQLISSGPRQFDLVLTDMTMPKMNGAELAQKMLAIRHDLPIVLCTGFSEKINEQQAKDLGIRGYVMKPVIRKDVATVVRRLLDP